MNIRKGLDRISIVLAFIAIVPGFVLGRTAYIEAYDVRLAMHPLTWAGYVAGVLGSSIAFFSVMLGIRGIVRLVSWIIKGFQE